MKLFIKLFPFLFFISCTLNDQADGPTGAILLGFQSSESGVMSLPINIVSTSFTNVNNKVFTININKKIELAILESQFISTLELPSGEYHSVKLAISMKDSSITLFDSETQSWIEGQMLSHDNLLIPQVKPHFFVELNLPSPFIIEANSIQLHRLTIDLQKTLKPSRAS